MHHSKVHFRCLFLVAAVNPRSPDLEYLKILAKSNIFYVTVHHLQLLLSRCSHDEIQTSQCLPCENSNIRPTASSLCRPRVMPQTTEQVRAGTLQCRALAGARFRFGLCTVHFFHLGLRGNSPTAEQPDKKKMRMDHACRGSHRRDPVP